MSHELIKAATSGDLGKIKQLITRGVDINYFHEGSGTALNEAARAGKPEVIKELIKANADVNIPSYSEASALTHASGAGHVEIVNDLIKAGADVNYSGNHHDSALYVAVRSKKPDVVIALIKAGANVNYAGKLHGGTVLHISKDLHTVKTLIYAGSNLNAKNREGKMPIDLNLDKPDIVETLISHGAKYDHIKTSYLRDETKQAITQAIKNNAAKQAVDQLASIAPSQSIKTSRAI